MFKELEAPCALGEPHYRSSVPLTGPLLHLSLLTFIWLSCSIWNPAKIYNSIIFISTPSSNDSSIHLFTQQVAVESQVVDQVKSGKEWEGAVG